MKKLTNMQQRQKLSKEVKELTNKDLEIEKVI